MTSILGELGWRFAALSLVSIGGANAALPEIHRQVVTVLHWMDDPAFAHLFAVSQASPGPNIQFVSLIGWHMAGVAGLAVATAAIVLPSSALAFVAGRTVRRFAGAAWVQVATAALVPIAVGLMGASGIVASRAADHSVVGWAITAAAAGFVMATRRNPLWTLAAGVLVSIVATRLGLPP